MCLFVCVCVCVYVCVCVCVCARVYVHVIYQVNSTQSRMKIEASCRICLNEFSCTDELTCQSWSRALQRSSVFLNSIGSKVTAFHLERILPEVSSGWVITWAAQHSRQAGFIKMTTITVFPIFLSVHFETAKTELQGKNNQLSRQRRHLAPYGSFSVTSYESSHGTLN